MAVSDQPLELYGLGASLQQLSLRASCAAVCIPIVAVAVSWLLTGSPPDSNGTGGDLPPAALTLLLGTFVLVPMLALAAAGTGVATAYAILRSPSPARRRALRAGMVVGVAAWALLCAYWYVAFVVPALTA